MMDRGHGPSFFVIKGRVLHGIARDPVLGPKWVFKGGTCLKKYYFETYRFSEDLDFTITEPGQIDEGFLLERFRMIGARLYDETGVELPADLMRFKVWDNHRDKRAGEAKLAYRGPIAPRGRDLPLYRTGNQTRQPQAEKVRWSKNDCEWK